ncbi:magnesium transporter [Persicobacter diffluens]|uniref:Magnesium transporter MgtE n=1 Tax=Persicobacter diffluens TaxID=981 RepID=A0AAN5AJ01_9BACT|nr:magnesium transporter MgtE [Persicobacter diffluens]
MTKFEKKQWLSQLLEHQNVDHIIEQLKEMPTIEVASILKDLPHELIPTYYHAFSIKQRAYILADFPEDEQLLIFHQTEKMTFGEIFEAMESNERMEFYRRLEPEEQINLLPFLHKEVRMEVLELSKYPAETAGGIMSTDFATVMEKLTCAEAIDKVRRDAPSKKMIYYIYAVDQDMRLQGFLTMKDLIMATPETLVKEVVHHNYVASEVSDDRELVAQKIEMYDLVALPVVNQFGQLVGIVTHDEAIEVIRQEQTEDMEKFMGIMPEEDPENYFDTSTLQHFKKRVVWIVGLAALGIISGMIIHRFEDALEKMIILALYMPMMADTGGNSGSQSATVVIRAMALGQINLKQWVKVIWKEIKISAMLALLLAILTMAKVLFLSSAANIPEGFSLLEIASVIALALGTQVITSAIIGTGLPLTVKKFGGDPAVVASPAITTIVDITGLLIYFGMATLFFF